MGLLSLLFPERRSTAVIARERLKIVLAHERASRDAPDFLPVLQKELLLRASWAFQHLDIVSSAVSEAYFAEQHGQARHRDRMMRDLGIS